MTAYPSELRRSGLASELADLAGLDPNRDPGKRSQFEFRVEEMLREEFEKGRESVAEDASRIMDDLTDRFSGG